MTGKIKTLYCLLLCFANAFLYGQSTSVLTFLRAVDRVKSDSMALVSLDSLVKTKLTTKQLLEADIRMVVRAFMQQKFEKAIAVGNQGSFIAHENKLDSMEAAFNEHLGNTNYYMDNRPRAIVHYKKGVEIAGKNAGAWEVEAACYNNMSAAYIDMKDYKNGEMYLLRSMGLMIAHGKENDPNTRRSQRILASLYASTGRSVEAEALFAGFIEKARKSRDTVFLFNNLIFYSDFLRERHDSVRALALSTEAMQYMHRAGDFQDQLVCMRYHSANLAAVGRAKEAYELMITANDLLKKSFAEDLNKQISEVEVKYKTARIQQEKEQAEASARQQKWIYLVSFAGILILLGAVAFYFNQRKTTEQKAKAHQERLEALIEGEEKERTRIARDLHDGIVQDLAAIKLKLVMAKDNEAKLHSAMTDIDRATKEVRDIAYQMMPVALREYGLVAALDHLLEKSLTPNNIVYEFETVNIEERLPEKIEVCLYRITQELINNVVKHSKASAISLVVSRYHDAVTLIMEDNGKGFKEAEIKKGIGMNSLSSRLEMVNGNLKFESTEGAGTIAIIKIPLTS